MSEAMAAGPTRRIERVLIANRGEIAVRIARTCRQMGLGVVAVYSSADERALHVLVADDAICIGAPPAMESYLRIDAVLDAARKGGADAIHPGYGFLAESANFARAVTDAGLIWVGPPAEAITLMGDKVAAKALAERVGVPTVPGYMGEDQSLERLTEAAAEVGYPVLLKASAGGGGKGMREVSRREGLAEALEGAKREARSAFGDDRVFLEKLLVRPRHVEVQVLLDAHGNGVYLGDRDCSLQRRHQKVVEEAPAPGLSPEVHRSIGEAALSLARAAGYVNAGTVEFLLDGDQYYFLEMNTRLQVEHPVTEMVTDLDLVRLQLEIAGGAKLPFEQDDVHLIGHAVEARVYAEDPAHGFLPATGTVRAFYPPEGEGVRNDVGVYRGAEITPFYDPLLAKVTAYAATREQSISALQSALDAYVVEGPTTNLEFLQWLVSVPEFRAGVMDIGLIDRDWGQEEAVMPPAEVLAVAAAAHLSGRDTASWGSVDRANPWRRSDVWRQRGVPRSLQYRYGDRTIVVEALETGAARWRVSADGEEVEVIVIPDLESSVKVRRDGPWQEVSVEASPGDVAVTWQGRRYRLRRGPVTDEGVRRASTSADGGPTTPMPGTVVKVAVTAGQLVAAHEPLVVLEAMKMEHVVEAPYNGTVTRVLVDVGDLVTAGSAVVELEPA